MFFLSTTRHILPLLSQSHFKKCHYSPVIAHSFIIVVSLLPEYLSLEFSFTLEVQRDLEGWRWNTHLSVTLFYILRGAFIDSPNAQRHKQSLKGLKLSKSIFTGVYESLFQPQLLEKTPCLFTTCFKHTDLYSKTFSLKTKTHQFQQQGLSCIYWE